MMDMSTHSSMSDDSDGMIFIPDVIPLLPLPRTILLPGEVVPLHVFEPRYQTLVRDALSSHRVIGMVDLVRAEDAVADGQPPVRDLGCVGMIGHHVCLDDGQFLIWLVGLERFAIDHELDSPAPYRQAKVTYLPRQVSGVERARLRPLRLELERILPTLIDMEQALQPELRRQLEVMTDRQLIALACQAIEMPSPRKLEMLRSPSLGHSYNMLYEDIYSRQSESVDLAELEPLELN